VLWRPSLSPAIKPAKSNGRDPVSNEEHDFFSVL
jgi:hypothetical protein